MEDKEEGEKITARGNEWEVVSLTASTYAAAPGPKEIELKGDDSYDLHSQYEAEASRALFMSDHFIFPPSQHENLPLEPDCSEIRDEHTGENVTSRMHVEESDKSGRKNEEIWTPKDLTLDTGLEESETLQDLNVGEKERSIYSTVAFSSLDSETGLGVSPVYNENLGIPEVNEPSEWDLDAGASNSSQPAKDGQYDGSGVPCARWWKRNAVSLIAHAKEANAFWSIFIAATVTGLVILGQRWQQEKWQVLQLKWQASINSEKSGWMLGPLTRLKDVIVGGHHHGALIGGTSSSEN